MAEAFLNDMCLGSLEAKSAGISSGELNPLAVEAMREVGVDISTKTTKQVFDLYRRGERFNYVIALCDQVTGERCPIFPGITKRIDWSFEDPAAMEGTREERLGAMRTVRDQIRARLSQWCAEVCAG
jgi:arsenate reductase